MFCSVTLVNLTDHGQRVQLPFNPYKSQFGNVQMNSYFYTLNCVYSIIKSNVKPFIAVPSLCSNLIPAEAPLLNQTVAFKYPFSFTNFNHSLIIEIWGNLRTPLLCQNNIFQNSCELPKVLIGICHVPIIRIGKLLMDSLNKSSSSKSGAKHELNVAEMKRTFSLKNPLFPHEWLSSSDVSSSHGKLTVLFHMGTPAALISFYKKQPSLYAHMLDKEIFKSPDKAFTLL
jgi:hypothetical protein